MTDRIVPSADGNAARHASLDNHLGGGAYLRMLGFDTYTGAITRTTSWRITAQEGRIA
jgi:hypothetical protein